MAAAQAQFADEFADTPEPQVQEPERPTGPDPFVRDPLEVLTEFGVGLAQGGKEVVSGTLQTALDLAGKMFPESERIEEFRQAIPEAVERSRTLFEARQGDSTPAAVGEFVGEVAPFVAAIPAGGATLLGRAAAGAAGGAAAAGTTATQEQLSPEEAVRRRTQQAAIGGSVGAALPTAVSGVRAGFRGLTKINPSAARDFNELGVQQSLASISDSPTVQLTDRFLAKFPGGNKVVAKNTEKVLADLNRVVDDLGANKAVSKEEAGIVLKEGIEGYANKFSKTAEKLYNRLDRFIPADSKVGVNNAARVLQGELEGVAGTPALAARLERNEGMRVLSDLTSDAVDGQIPYSALKRYRTLIGKKLNDVTLLGGEDRAVLKKAYTALSDDMAAAAQQAGPGAANTLARANNFYSRGAKRIEDLQKITNRDSEVIFDTMLQRAKGGGARINSVMKSLKPEEREVVRGTVLRKLGEQTPGQAGTEIGFSARTFLTNWNKLSPEAKGALYGPTGSTYRKSLDQLARVSDRLTQVDRFANPSGTAQQLGALAVFGGSILGPVKVGGAVLGANTMARLMNNQKFVNWLAKSSSMDKLSPSIIASRMGQLKTIAKNDPIIAEDIAKYIAVVGATIGREENKGIDNE
jgi:hypothetical protein